MRARTRARQREKHTRCVLYMREAERKQEREPSSKTGRRLAARTSSARKVLSARSFFISPSSIDIVFQLPMQTVLKSQDLHIYRDDGARCFSLPWDLCLVYNCPMMSAQRIAGTCAVDNGLACGGLHVPPAVEHVLQSTHSARPVVPAPRFSATT